MERSETFLELAKKKLEIQKSIKPAEKSQDNPYFNSKYADLNEVMQTIRDAMTESKTWLLIEQYADTTYAISNENKERVVLTLPMVIVTTRITDVESGEWEEFEIHAMPDKNTPQAIGSTETYLRRYSIMPAFGITPTDDDGNSASGNADGMDQTQQPERRPLQTNGNGSRRQQSTRTTQSTAQPQSQPEITNRTINDAEFNILSKALAANQVSKDRWIEYVTDTFKVAETMQLTVVQFKQVLNTLETDPKLIAVGDLPF